MSGFVKARWSELGEIKVHMMGKGVFVFQMETEQDKQWVIADGPWSFSRHPVIIKPWAVGMPLDKQESLSMLASKIGVPVYADRTTSEQSRLTYARVSVEIGVENVLYDSLPIKYTSGLVIHQPITYERVPLKCCKCRQFTARNRTYRILVSG
ncbi:hypothetical protein LIER_03909 [Lithospermum erythrorhizon]|uniref:DUF4283 domain-containing protein n=1 Tax=Lithospermum erythrorhizon TaxID=34254 RepID=A0AAV3NW50_LITER